MPAPENPQTPERPDVRFGREACQCEPLASLGRRLLEETVEACEAAEATLWLLSEDGVDMEGTLNHGKTPEVIEQLSVPIADSVVGMVAGMGQAMTIGPEDYRNPTVDEKTGTPTLAMAAVPLFADGEICGALSVINPRDGGLFHSDHLELLQWKAYLMSLLLADRYDPI
jgi:GAF domain-containing protein